MAKSVNTNLSNICNDNLDEWLGSVGYLFPTTELETERFGKLYEDYDFKLSNVKIDIEAIMNGSYVCKSAVTRIVQIDTNEINELKMVARNGEGQVTDDIIAKMKVKHRKKNDDDQK